jgi:hypothetical protein
MTRTAVTITERPDHDGWAVTTAGETRIVPTAMQALTAIRAADTARVEAGASAAMTVITWEPTTAVGLAVVRVISGQRR